MYACVCIRVTMDNLDSSRGRFCRWNSYARVPAASAAHGSRARMLPFISVHSSVSCTQLSSLQCLYPLLSPSCARNRASCRLIISRVSLLLRPGFARSFTLPVSPILFPESVRVDPTPARFVKLETRSKRTAIRGRIPQGLTNNGNRRKFF